MQLKIDPEFKALIPPLTPDERKQLEENVIQDGCRDALITWNGIIIDGHNRYEICTNRNIDFTVKEMDFQNRDEAERWIIHNQIGRRNLSDYARATLVRKLKDMFREKAQVKQVAGGKYKNKLLVNLPKASQDIGSHKLCPILDKASQEEATQEVAGGDKKSGLANLPNPIEGPTHTRKSFCQCCLKFR